MPKMLAGETLTLLNRVLQHKYGDKVLETYKGDYPSQIYIYK